jgi:hypothetical protein
MAWLTDEEREENTRRDAEARQQGYTDAYAIQQGWL